jgi:hypothetical protein
LPCFGKIASPREYALGAPQNCGSKFSNNDVALGRRQLVVQYNGATLLCRYAFGAGVDRSLVWYERSTPTDLNLSIAPNPDFAESKR